MSDSVELMLLGMGTVFTFLTLLVIGVTVMSAIINRTSVTTNASNSKNNTDSVNAEIAAVAAAAWSKKNTSIDH